MADIEIYNNINPWTDYLNKSYIQLYGPTIKVFKLDKEVTQIDDLYIEEKRTGRVYLPPFDIKTLMNDNQWQTFMSIQGIQNKEELMTIHVNFNNMIQKIDELKNGHACDIKVKCKSERIPYISKTDKLRIWEGATLIKEIDILDGTPVSYIVEEINKAKNWECSFTGENVFAKDIVSFEKQSFFNSTFTFFAEKSLYKNCSDVIEIGDALLTNKWKLYEVTSVFASGNFGWQYNTFKIECKLADIEKFNLPGNYGDMIRRRKDGLHEKYNIEGNVSNIKNRERK